MTDDELEHYLSRFRVAEAPDTMRAAVLRTARRRRRYSDIRLGWAIAAAVTVLFVMQVRMESGFHERRLQTAIDSASPDVRALAEMLGPDAQRSLTLWSLRILEEQESGDVIDSLRLDAFEQTPTERLPW
jgi:hypothetical protein